jgi:uncharacterized protein involved in oxidation of intracellular sulfur
VRVFLMGDAVACAVAGQSLPAGHYTSIACSSRSYARRESPAAAAAWNARGLSEELLVDGARRSTLDELADWALWSTRR